MSNQLNLPKPFFVLAPMDDVTDTAFRRLVSGCADPDMYFTEFANADGLDSRGRQAVLQKLKLAEDETTRNGGQPLVAQIWGKNPSRYEKAVNEILEMGYDGVDINFGCPVPKVVKNGCCSAMVDNRPLAGELIKAMQSGADGRIATSVKCRIGLNKIDLSWIEFLLGHNLDMLTVHGRTTKEMSKVPMHWEVFDEIVTMRDRISPKTLIVANGDVKTKAEGLEKAKQYGLDGIMIGRGIFQNPCVFDAENTWAEHSRKQRLELFLKHIDLFEESWFVDGQLVKNPYVLRKFAKVYVNGFDGASDLRAKVMACETLDDMRAVLLTSIAQ